METAETTLLYHGLPAVLVDGQWVVISSRFDQIASIQPELIHTQDTFSQLTAQGFFETAAEDSGLPEISLATLITTSDCNLNCRYCFANSGETQLYMSPQIAAAAIRRAFANAQGRRVSIAFFGGEPSLTPQIIQDAVAYARSLATGHPDIKGLEFSITTNGVMPQKFRDFLVRENFLVNLSADGAPEIQNRQRPGKHGAKSAPAVEHSIRAFVVAGLEMKIRATVTDISVGHMAEMVDWLHSLGASQLHFEPLSIAGRAALLTRGERMTRPDVADFAANLKAAILRGSELGVGVVNSSFMNLANPPREFCEGNPRHRFAITYSGDVTTCVEVQDRCHPVSGEFMVGRYDPDSDEVIATKSRGRATSACQLVSIQARPDNPCANCFAQRICGGGCPVRNYHITGDSATVDPYRCQLVREMIPFAYGLLDQESGNEDN